MEVRNWYFILYAKQHKRREKNPEDAYGGRKFRKKSDYGPNIHSF